MNCDGYPSRSANASIKNVEKKSKPVDSDCAVTIDHNGNIYENVGFFPSALSTHQRIFYTSISDYLANTKPIGFDDLNIVAPIPYNFFTDCNTIKASMFGTFDSGDSSVLYSIRLWVYDYLAEITDISCIPNQTEIPFWFEVEVTFRSDNTAVSNQKFSYQDPLTNTLKIFSSFNNETYINQSVDPVIKIDANTAGLSNNENNSIVSRQCTISFS